MSSKIRLSAAMFIASGALAVGGAGVLGAGVAFATPVHTGCTAIAAGGSSGWCGLYPGNATDNVRDLGQVSLSGDASMLTIKTLSVDSGAAPRTSFACLTKVPAAQITHRLQDTQCNDLGGVWITWSGPSITINVSQYTQFAGGNFTVQVAANEKAGNGNGDAFYNSFGVTGFIGY